MGKNTQHYLCYFVGTAKAQETFVCLLFSAWEKFLKVTVEKVEPFLMNLIENNNLPTGGGMQYFENVIIYG